CRECRRTRSRHSALLVRLPAAVGPVAGCTAAGWRGNDRGASALSGPLAASTAQAETRLVLRRGRNALASGFGNGRAEAPAGLLCVGRIALTTLVGLPTQRATAGVEGVAHG